MYSLQQVNLKLKNKGIMKTIPNLLSITPIADIKVIEETLLRIGVANKIEKILYPSCYLWNTEGTYYLAHFKQLFFMTRENGYDNISHSDLSRRNAIAFLLKNWKLISVDEESIKDKDDYVFVLPFSEKCKWNIQHKFNIKSVHNHQVTA